MEQTEKECFWIDLEKLNQVMKAKGRNDATVSKAVGYHRGWLYQVKRQKTPKVELAIAQKIADYLECGMQDFGIAGRNQNYNPITFKRIEEAKVRFNRLLPRYGVMFADLFRYIEECPEEMNFELASGIDYLHLSTMKEARITKQLGYVGTEWIKILYVSVYARTLANRLTAIGTQEDIFNKYQIEMERVSKHKVNKGKRKEAETIEQKQKILREIVEEELVEKADEILEDYSFCEDVADECARFLYWTFMEEDNNLQIELQKNLYKNGKLY